MYSSAIPGWIKIQVSYSYVASAVIAKTDQGFNFLGHHFGPEGLAIAQKTLNNFVERVIRLYEQGPGEPCGSTRLGEYAERWVRWARAGFGNIDFGIHGFSVNSTVFVICLQRDLLIYLCREKGDMIPFAPSI